MSAGGASLDVKLGFYERHKARLQDELAAATSEAEHLRLLGAIALQDRLIARLKEAARR